jgi:hypothetical protein
LRQISNEVLVATGSINFMPATKNNDKFLLGEYNEESQVGDLVLYKIQHKYFGYNFILRTPRFIYLNFQAEIYIWQSDQFDPNLNMAKLLEIIYQKHINFNEEKNNKTFGLDFLPSAKLAFG